MQVKDTAARLLANRRSRWLEMKQVMEQPIDQVADSKENGQGRKEGQAPRQRIGDVILEAGLVVRPKDQAGPQQVHDQPGIPRGPRRGGFRVLSALPEVDHEADDEENTINDNKR